jgi:hypothetical protein
MTNKRKKVTEDSIVRFVHTVIGQDGKPVEDTFCCHGLNKMEEPHRAWLLMRDEVVKLLKIYRACHCEASLGGVKRRTSEILSKLGGAK